MSFEQNAPRSKIKARAGSKPSPKRSKSTENAKQKHPLPERTEEGEQEGLESSGAKLKSI